jgi:hypothetical protein
MALQNSLQHGVEQLIETQLPFAVQVAEVQLRQGQQHTALHALQVPLSPGRSAPAADADRGTPGAKPAPHPAAASPAAARCTAEALDLAIVAHHASGRPVPALHTLSSWLSFFTVQHRAREDAAEDQYVCSVADSSYAAMCSLMCAVHSLPRVHMSPVNDPCCAGMNRYELQLVGKQQVPSICHAIAVLQAGDGNKPCQLAVACHGSLQVHSALW